MAKFQKAINLWDQSVVERILSGDLVLQVGQWVKCGSNRLSRFVAVNNGVFDVVHYPNEVRNKFNIRVLASKASKGVVSREHYEQKRTELLGS